MVSQLELNKESIFEMLLKVDIMSIVRKLYPNIGRYKDFDKESLRILHEEISQNMKHLSCKHEEFYEGYLYVGAICAYSIEMLFGDSCTYILEGESLQLKLNKIKTGEIKKSGLVCVTKTCLVEDFNDVNRILSEYQDCPKKFDIYYDERFSIWEIQDKIFLNYAKLNKDNTVNMQKLMYILQGILSIRALGGLIIGYEVKEDKIEVLFHEEGWDPSYNGSEAFFDWCVSSVIESIILKMCIEMEINDVEGK